MSQAPPLQIETITKPVTSAISTKRFLVTATQACFGECWRTGSLKYTPVLMMMSFICSCRNNNQPNAIYPLGTFHWGLKKLKKAAKAHVMMLASSHHVPYGTMMILFPIWLTLTVLTHSWTSVEHIKQGNTHSAGVPGPTAGASPPPSFTQSPF